MNNPNKIPGSSDLIRFAYREVWDPKRRSELLSESYPGEFSQFMLRQGYDKEWSDSYWAAHWDLPSVSQLNEMLHRRVIDDATYDRFIKYNDFDPVVRPWLKAISYDPYTRVDVRRMKDLGLVTDEEVFDNYRDLGYNEDHAHRMTIWTNVYNLSVELRARYAKGWITVDDVKNTLIAAGMPKSKAEIFVQKLVANTKEDRTTKERDLTKAEIVKGVKEGVLSEEDAILMLEDMGYDEAEAEYILLVNVQATTGSPETWSEFQEIVNARRKSQGLKVVPIPEQVKPLEKEIIDLTAKRSTLIAKNAQDPEIKIINDKIADLQKKHSEIRKTG